MIQQKSKREEFEELEREIYDAVDEAFDEATNEVAGILKGYRGIDSELYREQENSSAKNKKNNIR